MLTMLNASAKKELIPMDERRLVSPAEIKEKLLRWLWLDRLPLGGIAVIDGDPGSGKSSVTYDIAARVTTGSSMPACTIATAPAGVVLIQGEDLAGGTVLPALRAAGADLDKIRLLDRERFIESPLQLPKDMEIIKQAAREVQAKLVVIDPFTAFLAGNSNGDAAVRKALGPLSVFAEQQDLTVVVIRHLRKSGASNPLYAGLGSIGVIGAVRSGLVVLADPCSDNKHQHILAQTKGNLATAVSLSYRTIKRPDATIGVEWSGPSTYAAADLMGGVDDNHSAVAEAEYVLYSILVDGPVPAKECLKFASEAGVSERTLKRAKKQMGIPSWKEGHGKDCRWLWELPNNAQLLQRFKEKDIAQLVERLVHGNVARTQSLAGKRQQDVQPDDHGDNDGGDGVAAIP
jgi:hypothetical protein